MSTDRKDFTVDFLIEFISEIIFEGALGSISNKRIPMFFRVLVAVIFLAFYLGLGGILIYAGILYKSAIIVAVAVLLLLAVAYLVFKKFRQIKK